MDFQKKFILKRDDASMDKDDNQVGLIEFYFFQVSPLSIPRKLSYKFLTMMMLSQILDPRATSRWSPKQVH